MSVEVPAHFLDIVKRTARECRVAGTGPSAVTGQTGLNSSLVGWCAEAWVEIQNLHEDWSFLRTSASFASVAGTALYTIGTGAGTVGVVSGSFGSWVRDSFRAYLTATGTNDEQYLFYRDWASFRDLWLFNANRSLRTRPYEVTIDPAFSIGLGPTPAAGYTITGDYFRKTVFLEADADVPACPKEFFMLIVYLAMKKYGAREGAPRIYSAGATEYNRMLPQLEERCLPQLMIGSALA